MFYSSLCGSLRIYGPILPFESKILPKMQSFATGGKKLKNFLKINLLKKLF
jgi:hypothetical protein